MVPSRQFSSNSDGITTTAGAVNGSPSTTDDPGVVDVRGMADDRRMTAPSPVADPPSVVEARTTLALLTFDGFVCAVLSVLFLPAYIGTTPFPVTILIAAVVNLLLVLGARRFTDRALGAAAPLIGWLAGFAVCAIGGPGGDVLVVSDWRTLLLVVAALLPGVLYLFRVRLETLVAQAQS